MAVDTRLHGIHSALVTPLEADRKTVDAKALAALLDHVIGSGASGVVVLGGTGEYVALTPQERMRAVEATVRHVNGRVPVTVGIVEPGLGDAIGMAEAAAARKADFVMPVTPYYQRPEQGGLRDWFISMAEASPLPILLYNIPSKTQVNLLPVTIEQILDSSDNVVGIKECYSDLGQFTDLVTRVGDRFVVMAGEDHFSLAEFLLGAKGAILASSNLIPGKWSEIYKLASHGEFVRAVELNKAIAPLIRAIFLEHNPVPLKAALKMIGIPVGACALPLSDCSTDTIAALEKALGELEDSSL